MKKLLMTMLLLPLLSSLGLGAEGDLSNDAELRERVTQFRKSLFALGELINKPERTLEEEVSYKKALGEFRWKQSAVVFYGVHFQKGSESEEAVLINQRKALLEPIWAEWKAHKNKVNSSTSSTPH